MRLKRKIVFPVIGAVLLIGLLSNMIAGTMLDRQGRQASHGMIKRAFQFTEEALVLKEKALLEYIRQFETRPVHYALNKVMKLGDQPHRISAITYKNTAEMIHSLGGGGKTIEVFNQKKEPIVFSVSQPDTQDGILLGYVHHKEKIVVTAQIQAGGRISFDDWQIRDLESGGLARISPAADLGDETQVDWTINGKETAVFVCLPINKKVYEDKRYRYERIGWIKVTERVPHDFFARLKGFTGTEINLFTTGGRFSKGTLDPQSASTLLAGRDVPESGRKSATGTDPDPSSQGLALETGKIAFHRIEMNDTHYRVGVLSVLSGPKTVGTAWILYSTRGVDANARQVMMVLNLVLGLFLLITFFLVMTVRKQVVVQKKADRLKRYLDNVVNSMPSILIGVDKDGKVTQWNRTAELKTGISPDGARDKTFAQVFPWMTRDMDRIQKSIRDKVATSDKKRARAVGDEVCYEDITIYPLAANGIEGAVIRIDDVTEAVRMEEMMIQSEKMLSVGGLAAGMAHEINNPLAGMIQTANVMSSRLTRMDLPANVEAAQRAGTSMAVIQGFMEERKIPSMLSTIQETGIRVAEIVDNMLNFARKTDAQVSLCSLSDLLDRILLLAETDYDLKKNWDFKRIKIQKIYDKRLPPVPCEQGKIQQVILNILRNGAQAMQDAGTTAPEFRITTRLDREKKMACMEIADNGPGMDKGLCKRIFEPFFTTKGVGLGTGLGLSVSYFIVTENHGGTITVHSEPGEGALFTVCLPLEKKGNPGVNLNPVAP